MNVIAYTNAVLSFNTINILIRYVDLTFTYFLNGKLYFDIDELLMREMCVMWGKFG